MKKLFAVMLALVLLLGSASLADVSITWEQAAPMIEAAGITGSFYTFDEVSVAIFIPDGMAPAELPDESYIGYFVSEDQSSAVAVCYVNVEGMDLDTYAAEIQKPEIGAADIETGTVNGLPCVSYEVPAQNTVNIAFTTQAGYILEVVFGPVTTEEEKAAAGFIAASIQNIEE